MSAFTQQYSWVILMVKATMDIRIKSVILYQKGTKTEKEISSIYNISERTFRRWDTADIHLHKLARSGLVIKAKSEQLTMWKVNK